MVTTDDRSNGSDVVAVGTSDTKVVVYALDFVGSAVVGPIVGLKIDVPSPVVVLAGPVSVLASDGVKMDVVNSVTPGVVESVFIGVSVIMVVEAKVEVTNFVPISSVVVSNCVVDIYVLSVLVGEYSVVMVVWVISDV